MHSNVGDTVHYILYNFVVQSQMEPGVFRVDCKQSKARRVEVTRMICFLSAVERADINGAGLAAIGDQNVASMKKRNKLVYQLVAPQEEVLSHQRKTEGTLVHLRLWKDRDYQRQLKLDQQTKTISSLRKKLLNAESDCIAVVEELDQSKKQSQSLLEHPQFQPDTVTTLNRDLPFRDYATKLGQVLSLHEQLMLPKGAPVEFIKNGLRNLI